MPDKPLKLPIRPQSSRREIVDCMNRAFETSDIAHGRFQPRSATSEPLRRFPVRRHALAAVKAPVLLGSPRLLIAPGLKIGIGALRQKHAPRGLKIGARLVKGCSYAIRTFPCMTAGIEAARPAPQIFVMPNAS